MSLVVRGRLGTLLLPEHVEPLLQGRLGIRTAISTGASRPSASCRPMRRKVQSSLPTSRPRGGVASAARGSPPGTDGSFSANLRPPVETQRLPGTDQRRRFAAADGVRDRNRADAGDLAAERLLVCTGGSWPGSSPRPARTALCPAWGSTSISRRRICRRTSTASRPRCSQSSARPSTARASSRRSCSSSQRYDEWVSEGGAGARR